MTTPSTSQEGRADFFKPLFDQSPFAMQIFSPDGTLLKANRAWESLWQIKLSESAEPYNLFKDKQACHIGLTAIFEKVLSGKSVNLSDIEYDPKLSGLSGEKHFLHVRMLPLEQIAGEVEGVICIVEDVTEQKQVELELQRSQKRLEEKVKIRTKHLEALLRFSTDLTTLSGSEKIFPAVTGGAKNLLQFDYSTLFILSHETGRLVMRDTIGFPQNMVGSFMLLADEGLPSLVARKKCEAVVEDFKKENRFSIPNIIFEEKITSSLAVPMMNKGEVIGVLIGHNWQKRVFTENEISLYQSFANQAAVSILNTMNLLSLQESEENFRHLFENANDAIYLIEPDSRQIVSCNRRATLLDGYSREELTGMINKELHPPEEQDIVYKKYQELIDTGSFTSVRTYHHLRKDGTWVPVEISSTMVEISGKKLIMSIIRDITKRIELQKEQEIVASKLRRSQKMEAIGLMAGGVAHDLNNILSGIVSYPQLLLRQLPEDSPFRGPIETIRKAGNRAAAVTADLITVARGVASCREIKNINNLIADYMRSPEYVQLVKQSEHIQIVTDFDQDLFNINCSPVHLGKVFFNLVLNATEALNRGGEIHITTGNQYVDTPLKRYDTVVPGEYVVLKIADNGPGISNDDIDRIFEPFYTKKVMGRSGTGLGLAVVWNTVVDHDGYIDVSSSNQGTLFELYFPASRATVQEQVDAHNCINALRGNGETVLVVDDVGSQREIVCGMLEELGYRAEAVSSGEEAVAHLQKKSTDLIILDMIMEPGINGRETYEKIIADHPGQKAVIASGFSETSEVKKAQELGAGKYIKKPYTLEVLALAIKEELVRCP